MVPDIDRQLLVLVLRDLVEQEGLLALAGGVGEHPDLGAGLGEVRPEARAGRVDPGGVPGRLDDGTLEAEDLERLGVLGQVPQDHPGVADLLAADREVVRVAPLAVEGLVDRQEDLEPLGLLRLHPLGRPPVAIFEVRQRQPGPGAEAVGLDRGRVGLAGLLEGGRVEGEQGVPLGDRRVRPPGRRHRAVVRPHQHRPGAGQAHGRPEAPRRPEPAAKAVVAEVHPEGQRYPEHHRDRGDADPARRQEVDRHRQDRHAQARRRDRQAPPELRPEDDGAEPGGPEDQPTGQEVPLRDRVELAEDPDRDPAQARHRQEPAGRPGRGGRVAVEVGLRSLLLRTPAGRAEDLAEPDPQGRQEGDRG